MKKKEFILIILVLMYWLLPQMHMLMSSLPAKSVDLFVFAEESQDIQWYFKNMCDYISSFFLIILVRKVIPYKLKFITTLLIIGLVLDIVNYWLFYHQNDWAYKSLLIFLIPIIYITNEKRNNNRTGTKHNDGVSHSSYRMGRKY